MRTFKKSGWLALGAMIVVLQLGATFDILASDNLQEPDLWVGPHTTQAMPEERTLRDAKKRLRSDAERIRRHRRVDLAAPSAQEIQSKMTQRDWGPTKIGFSRTLPGFATQEQTRAELDWQRVDDGGMTTVLTFDSAGAAAVRLGIRVMHLPANAEFRFFPDNPDEAEMVAGADILAAIERNVAAGDPDDVARTYWSPVISGENISLEIYLPPNTSADEVVIAIPSLTHLMVSPTGSLENLNTRATGIGASGACNNDVSCDLNWADRSNAVARMIYTSGVYSYLCSGTLLNDAANSGTPYFLTANHCISTQSEASSLNTYWFYRSTACNSGILNASYRTLSTGAALLYQSANTDTSFLRLNSAAPGGVTFSGWTTAAPTITSASTGIHHPRGDLQKISYGSVTGFLNCTAPDSSGMFTCSSSSTGNYANIQYSSGITEPGSSGSGIFLNGGQYLFGQLYGGTSSCTNPSGSNIYGRFDKAYAAGNLGQWLNAGNAGLFAAVLPYARSVQIGQPATAFGTIVNATGLDARGCYLALPASPAIPATFNYQTTNASNQLVGKVNTPIDIPAGGSQSFVFGITPSAAFAATNIPVVFDCANTLPAPSQTGLNTFLLSASSTPVPDMVAIGATPSGDGVLRIPGSNGVHAFGTAAVNIGGAGEVTATVDTGGVPLPLTLTVCQTNPGNGQCLSPPASSSTSTLATNASATYAVFAQASGAIPFDPAGKRIFLRLSSGGVVRGATSVAVTTQ